MGDAVKRPSSEPHDDASTAPASGGTGDTAETPVKGGRARPLQEHSVAKGWPSGRTGLSLKKKRRQCQAVPADSQPPKSSEAEEGSADLVLVRNLGKADDSAKVNEDEEGDDGAKLKVGAGEKGGKDDELNMDDL